MLTWRLFPRVNQSREQTELLVCWKAIGIQTNDLSVYNSFQRISHGCNGRGEKGAMLLYRSIVPSVSSLVSLLTERLHKLYYPGSCSKPYMIKRCNRLVQISASFSPGVRRQHPCNRRSRHFEHVACPPRPRKRDGQIYI